jgi:hypothetical protein
MPIVGGLDIYWKQITFDYLDTVTGQVQRGQIAPADRAHLRAWLGRFAGRDDVAFAVEGCAGWRYVTEELAAADIEAHLAERADTVLRRIRSVTYPLRARSAGQHRELTVTPRIPSGPQDPEPFLCWPGAGDARRTDGLISARFELRPAWNLKPSERYVAGSSAGNAVRMWQR